MPRMSESRFFQRAAAFLAICRFNLRHQPRPQAVGCTPLLDSARFIEVVGIEALQAAASAENVPMNTPFLARLPWSAPTNLWISGRPTVPSHFLGLQVHNVKSKAVFADHTIDALVARPADGLAGIPPSPSVTHPQEQLDDETLEELRGRRLDAAQKFGS